MRLQLLAVIVLLVPVSTAAAEWRVTLGGIYALSDSTFTADDIGADQDLDIDFERDLALEDESFLPQAEIAFHFADQHAISLSYIQLHRDGSNEARDQSFEVNWIDDTTYRVDGDAAIRTTFDYEVYRLYYSYDFLASDRHQLGLSAGLHVIPIFFEMEGEIDGCLTEGQQEVCSDLTSESISDEVTAPLPNFGAFGTWGFARQWELEARLQYFYLKVDSIEGGLLDLSTTVRYGITDNWYVGAGYSFYDLRATHDGDRADLEVDVRYHGARGLLELRF